jgi:hypothetical protein
MKRPSWHSSPDRAKRAKCDEVLFWTVSVSAHDQHVILATTGYRFSHLMWKLSGQVNTTAGWEEGRERGSEEGVSASHLNQHDLTPSRRRMMTGQL